MPFERFAYFLLNLLLLLQLQEVEFRMLVAENHLGTKLTAHTNPRAISMWIGPTEAEFEELRILAIRQGTTAPKLIAEQIRKLWLKRPKS